MGKKIVTILLILLMGKLSLGKITIFTIGDSTMAQKPSNSTERGWGMLLPTFVNPDDVDVSNNGFDGRSSKSFISEGRWSTVLSQLQSGDFVFIQFGHNDAKPDASLHTDPYTTYSQNLEKFISETRARGATPVLLTPIIRRNFDNNEEVWSTHGEYPDAVRKVAEDLSVPLIDMELKTRLLEGIAGLVGSREIHQWNPPSEIDNTHLGQYGAYVVARMVAEGVKELELPISLNDSPNPLNNAYQNSMELAYAWLNKNIQEAQSALSSMSSASGRDPFAGVISAIQADYDNQSFINLETLDSAVRELRRAEKKCRWTLEAPLDATFAIGDPSFEEGGYWSNEANAVVPLSWTLKGTLLRPDIQLKNTGSSDGIYHYYIWGDAGSSIDFYRDLYLPPGGYNLQADLKPNSGTESSLYVNVEGRTHESSGGTWQSWGTAKVEFNVPAGGDTVRIGVSSSRAVMIDNFRLERTEAPTPTQSVKSVHPNIAIINETNGITIVRSPITSGLKKLDIYTLAGKRVMTLEVEKQLFVPLDKGLYVVGGHKVIVM